MWVLAFAGAPRGSVSSMSGRSGPAAQMRQGGGGESDVTDSQDDPIERWARTLSPRSGVTYVPVLKRFLDWVGIDARTLIERQKHVGPDDQYEILDKVQEYVRGYRGTDRSGKQISVTLKTRQTVYDVIRSLFGRSRAPLPSDKQFGRTLKELSGRRIIVRRPNAQNWTAKTKRS